MDLASYQRIIDHDGFLSTAAMRAYVVDSIAAAGGQRALARAIGVRQPDLSAVVTGKCAVGPALAKKLGFSVTRRRYLQYQSFLDAPHAVVISATQMRQVVADHVKKLGSIRELARRAGVHPWHVSDVLRGRRSAGRQLAAAFELCRDSGVRVEYRPIVQQTSEEKPLPEQQVVA